MEPFKSMSEGRRLVAQQAEKITKLEAELVESNQACLGWAHKCDKIEAKIAALRNTLWKIGNRAGAPTMNYSPDNENEERGQALKDISEMVIDTIGGHI